MRNLLNIRVVYGKKAQAEQPAINALSSGKVTVKLGEKLRKIKFGLGATRIVCDENKLSLSQLAERFDMDLLFVEEIYGGLVHAAKLEGKPIDFNKAQVYDWIDELPKQEKQRVFDVWLFTSQNGQTRYEKFVKALEEINGKTGEKKN